MEKELTEKEIDRLDLTAPIKVKRKKNDKTIVPDGLNGLEQHFKGSKGKEIQLSSILTAKEWWILKKKSSQVTIITHEGVKKIADAAGLQTNPRYSILISPTHENNYTIAMQCEICDNNSRCTIEIGEVNRNNLGTRGRQNPVNMAQKRAYDRAVFRHLGITGLLGEDEIADEEEEKEMDKLSNEDQKAIVPFINEIINSKTQAELKTIANNIKRIVNQYSKEQIDVLRGLWKKRVAELTKTF
jgi:hypothetical protein